MGPAGKNVEVMGSKSVGPLIEQKSYLWCEQLHVITPDVSTDSVRAGARLNCIVEAPAATYFCDHMI